MSEVFVQSLGCSETGTLFNNVDGVFTIDDASSPHFGKRYRVKSVELEVVEDELEEELSGEEQDELQEELEEENNSVE